MELAPALTGGAENLCKWQSRGELLMKGDPDDRGTEERIPVFRRAAGPAPGKLHEA